MCVLGRCFRRKEGWREIRATPSPHDASRATGCGRGKCVICSRKVCMGCSTFYTKRFCSDCGPLLISAGVLPPEMAQVCLSATVVPRS